MGGRALLAGAPLASSVRAADGFHLFRLDPGLGWSAPATRGGSALEALAQRPGGFVYASDEQVGEHEFERWLVALDPELRARWSRPLRGMEASGTPPVAGQGTLFRTNSDEVRLYDDATGAERFARLPLPGGIPTDEMIGTALGRGPDSSWIVVTYAPKRE